MQLTYPCYKLPFVTTGRERRSAEGDASPVASPPKAEVESEATMTAKPSARARRRGTPLRRRSGQLQAPRRGAPVARRDPRKGTHKFQLTRMGVKRAEGPSQESRGQRPLAGFPKGQRPFGGSPEGSALWPVPHEKVPTTWPGLFCRIISARWGRSCRRSRWPPGGRNRPCCCRGSCCW